MAVYSYTAPSQAVYGVGTEAYLGQVAQGVGLGAAAAYQAYALATAKGLKAADYITGTYGVLGTVFAAVPIVGPALQTFNLAVAGAQYLNDTLKAKRKKDRIKRLIRGAGASFESSVARGYPVELASYVAARNLGPTAQHTLGILGAVASSPYNPRGLPLPSGLTRQQLHALGPWVVDPDTGQVVTERALVSKYTQHERDLATAYELATRIAPARGKVPYPFARYRH